MFSFHSSMNQGLCTQEFSSNVALHKVLSLAIKREGQFSMITTVSC